MIDTWDALPYLFKISEFHFYYVFPVPVFSFHTKTKSIETESTN